MLCAGFADPGSKTPPRRRLDGGKPRDAEGAFNHLLPSRRSRLQPWGGEHWEWHGGCSREGEGKHPALIPRSPQRGVKGSILPDAASGTVAVPGTGLFLLTRQSLFLFSYSLRFSGLCGDTSQAPVGCESASVSVVGGVGVLQTQLLLHLGTHAGGGTRVLPSVEELLLKPQKYELQVTTQRKQTEILNICLGSHL